MLPTILYRFFQEREHAEAFINGDIRFGTLQKYRELEDTSRGDKTEGNGDLKVLGEKLVVDIQQGTMHAEPGTENLDVRVDPRNHFISCLTICNEEELPQLAKEFGVHCVIVENPNSLFEDLQLALDNDTVLSINPPTLECGHVRYDKGSLVTEQLNRDEKLELGWMQKPKDYAYQKEFRIHFNFTSHELIGSPTHHTLSIGKTLIYCKLY